MSVYTNKIVTGDELVLAVDFSDPTGYVGPNITNIASSISPRANSSGTGHSFTQGTESVFIPKMNTTLTSKYVDIQNMQSLSGICCPDIFGYGNVNVTGSTLHTYAILYRSGNGYTNPNYMYRYEYNVNTYVTETGVFDAAKRIDMGNGWYWAWNTFTTNASTTRLILNSFYYLYSNAANRFHVAKTLLVKGDYSNMRPETWPEVGTSRTNTTCAFDLAGTNQLTLTNFLYDSTGYPSFSGSYLNCGTGIDLRRNFSLECWAYITQNVSGLFGQGIATTNNGLHIYWNQFNNRGMVFGMYSNDLDTPGYNLMFNKWNHFVFTYNHSTYVKQFYANGVLVNAGGGTAWAGTGQFNIGATYSSGTTGAFGKIDAAKVYYKVLTSSEVLQNYNNSRARFGV